MENQEHQVEGAQVEDAQNSNNTGVDSEGSSYDTSVGIDTSQKENTVPMKRFNEVYYKAKEAERRNEQALKELEELKQFKKEMQDRMHANDLESKKQEFTIQYQAALDDGDHAKAARINADYNEYILKSQIGRAHV